MTIWTDQATLSGSWQHSVHRAPDETFLLFERPDGLVRTWTYGEFDRLVSCAAQFLRNHDVREGSAVHQVPVGFVVAADVANPPSVGEVRV